MMKKFLLLTLSQLFALCVLADGFPRYYKLIENSSQLESGKYYVVVAIPEIDNLDYRMAYNGINTTNHDGNAGKLYPHILKEQPGITPSQFSGIIDIGKEGNHAVPLIFVKNGDTWNFIDESSTENNRLIGIYSSTETGDQHYLNASNENVTDNLNSNLNRWIIDFVDGKVYIMSADIQKSCYLKYNDNNNYGDEANSFFRVYAIMENRNLMLYKEMETVTAETYFTGHGTLYYSDEVLMVPADVEAMTMTYNSTNKEVSCSTLYSTGSFIPKGSAVVLHNTRDESTFPEPGKASTYIFPVITRYNPEPDSENILSGLLDAEGYTTTGNASEDAKYYFYKLTTKNNANPGFYWADDTGSRFKMPDNAHKAYLALKKDDAKNVRGFLLDFIKTSTSITPSPITQHPTSDKVFDLSGRRVSTSQPLPKGIYISNGKKFVVK